MTSIDRVAKIIDSLHTADQILMEGSVGYFDAPAAAQELADAGLLAPKLPQPNPENDVCIDFGDVWIELDEPQRICIEMLPPSLSAQEAEALGLALLAAAQHAKGQA